LQPEGVCHMYALDALVFEETFAQTAAAVVSCAVSRLSEFYSPVASVWHTRVRDIPSAHLQGSKPCNCQDIRAEPQLISAVVTCAVSGLSVCYFLVASIYSNPGCAVFEAHTFWVRLHVFKKIFVQIVFAVVNCAVIGLSVFYSLVLTCNLIFLQLWLLGHSVECILHLHFELELW